jgi:hypothetical protein
MSVLGWPSRIVLAAGGLFVVGVGLAARVTGLMANGSGLVITYAARRPYGMAWEECDRLVPPRSPLGGWRVGKVQGSRTLMPSDLMGHEDVLDVIVRRASLRFDGRVWATAPGWSDVRKGGAEIGQVTTRVPVIVVGWNWQWKKYLPGGGAANE